MKKRMVIALLAASFAAGESFAADWPVTPLPQPYRPGPLLPVEWTGLYFGVNAGYGRATGSSTMAFAGGLTGAATTPSGTGATELGNASAFGSSSPRGGIEVVARCAIGFEGRLVLASKEVSVRYTRDDRRIERCRPLVRCDRFIQ